ncbi:MAG: CaiB/BaiF CoA transferase family protein [Candidatus Dormibacteria bacterium]
MPARPVVSAPREASQPGPLTGLVVADFSRILAGPYLTMLLADLGADVVKVERPQTGDDARQWGPPWSADGRSTYFLSVNRNKRSVELDLTDPGDLELARRLCERADVIVENFRPGTMAKYGLDEGALRGRNPGVVYCSISGFGSGAGATLQGYDLLVQAVGGLMSVTGPDAGTPTKVGVAMVDVLTGLHGAVGVLAALRERERTGQGQLVSVNLLSTLLSSLVNHASGLLMAGVMPQPMGNRHPSVAPYELLRAQDRPLAVAVGNDRQFAALCAALERPQLATDPRFTSNPLRVGNRDALVQELESSLSSLPARRWVARLQPMGIPCGVVNDVGEALELAGELGLRPVVDLLRQDGGADRAIADPISLSGSPVGYQRAAPALGEHSAELRLWLSALAPTESAGPGPGEGV